MTELREVHKDAIISPCGAYRYMLTRVWEYSRGMLPFVMLNPSMADDKIDDPTIRRCMNFAKREGYGGIFVANLFAFRATDPVDVRRAAIFGTDPIGPDNELYLRVMATNAKRREVPVICAWGAVGGGPQADHVARLMIESGATLKCLGVTKEGHPRHPLYLPANAPLIDYQMRDAGRSRREEKAA